jgi:hypothetical protein
VKGRYLSTEGRPALRYLSCTARNYLNTLVGHCPVRDISGFLGVLGRVFLYLAKHGVDSVGDQGLFLGRLRNLENKTEFEGVWRLHTLARKLITG